MFTSSIGFARLRTCRYSLMSGRGSDETIVTQIQKVTVHLGVLLLSVYRQNADKNTLFQTLKLSKQTDFKKLH